VTAERLDEGLLRREARGERARLAVAFALGEQALDETRGAGDRALEPRDVDDVDADADDHRAPPPRAARLIPPSRTSRGCAAGRHRAPSPERAPWRRSAAGRRRGAVRTAARRAGCA